MMLRLCLALLALVLAGPALAAPERGRFVEIERVAAAGLPDQHVSIWLPPGYDGSKRRYPVLYMHDGQNLFDPANAAFGKVWAADKAMLAVMASGTVEPHIIVGVWSPGSDRYRQYLPKDIYLAASPGLRAQMDQFAGGPIVSDLYLEWLAGPLKQRIDSSYRTKPGPRHTAIAGSSMGGLMSCYAFLNRPDIYGRAACVSTHWPAVDPAKLAASGDPELIALWDQWFAAKLGPVKGRRLWLDHGTATLDAFYTPYQQAVDGRLSALPWQRGRDWQSKVYAGAEHEENAWAARLPEIFGWMLRK